MNTKVRRLAARVKGANEVEQMILENAKTEVRVERKPTAAEVFLQGVTRNGQKAN